MKIGRRPNYLLSIILACVMLANPILANELGGSSAEEEDMAPEQDVFEEVPETEWETEVVWDGEIFEAEQTQEEPETEAEEEIGIIRGIVQMPEGMEQETIQVRVYDLATYVEDDQETAVDAVFTDKNGEYETRELLAGTYRLEFYYPDNDFDHTLYEEVPVPEYADYRFETVEDKEYFAFAELRLEEGDVFEFAVGLETIAVEEETEEMETGEETDSETEEEISAETEKVEVPQETEEEFAEETELANLPVEEESAVEAVVESETGNIIKRRLEEKELPTMEELLELGNEDAGATMIEDVSVGLLDGIVRFISGNNWTFDLYYVGEESSYHVNKTDDFSLKYQLDFHTSTDLEANSVEIRIPSVLFVDRDNAAIRPGDIGVPMGTVNEPVVTKYSPFNYYRDERTDELVFFNYRDISAGSNAAVQILYKNLKVMEIVDETSWELKPIITVGKGEEATIKEAAALTGFVDTQVNLTKVTKKAYNYTGTNYTPGLYTRDQVKSYISGSLPTEFENNFDDYVYVVWEVAVAGNATQPWNLRVKDTPTYDSNKNGTVVGLKAKINYPYMNPELLATGNYIGYHTGIEYSQLKKIDQVFHVVTAYPRSDVEEGTVLDNKIDVMLEPRDKKDDDQNMIDSDVWSYKNYKWEYGGDSLEVGKSALQSRYKGWLNVYEQKRNDGNDAGDLKYSSNFKTYGFSITHETEDEEKLGKLYPDMSYTAISVDDVLYAHSSNKAGTPAMLDHKDYYFSSISITQKDIGYNIWEDREAEPETAGDLVIYAMFPDSGNQWEMIEIVPWQSSGKMSYVFTKEDLERQPWRVKVEHNTTNYSTECKIDVEVCIRHDSPVFIELMKDNPESITVQNLAGITGEIFEGSVSRGNWSITGDMPPNYDLYPEDLKNITEELYGQLIPRRSAQSEVNWIIPNASSYKNAKATNDPQNGRVQVKYSLTAYDGYELYSQKGINELLAAGMESPGRYEAVFYDLLPYGVQFDPSVEIIAGRTVSFDSGGKYRSEPGYWDTSQVQVYVNSESDIIQNYEGTGRTMVAFHITYDGAESAFYNAGAEMWMEGWGVSFGAYYEWKDADIVDRVPNISAFMPKQDDDNDLIGSEGQVYLDNGELPPGLEEVYKDFGSDIDRDGNITERTVLYAHSTVTESIALSSESRIDKLVRADANRFGIFDTSAVVEEGAGYTYEMSIFNASGILEDIVVFDRLENAIIDRAGKEGGFDTDSWHGTFAGIQTRALEELGIKPVIYYHADRTAAELASESVTGAEALASAGWIKAEDWTLELADVEAFAVDITYKTNGEKFQLETLESISFQVQMKAPDSAEAVYAYNNVSFYSYEKHSEKKSWVEGSSIKVELNKAKNLEIEKRFAGEVPQILSDTNFEFIAYQEIDGIKSKLSSREYLLYQLDSEGQWQKAAGLHATNGSGKFYLCAGEKAVFLEMAGVENIIIEETENPYWKQNVIENEDNETKTIVFENKYNPVLYVQKLVASVPDGLDISGEEFTFQLSVNGQKLASTEFWYVDKVRTDGGIPNKETSKGINGIGTTDGEGKFRIRVGETIALFPGEAGVSYTLKEVAGAGEMDNWFCENDEVSGTVAVFGSSAHITNYYRWKDLYLAKKITNQTPGDCSEEFTFRVTDMNNNPVSGNTWVLMKDGVDTETSGTLNNDGEFLCVCAGGVVRIEGLEAGKTYTIQETESGEFYQAVNDGIVEVTMPKYGASDQVEITNDYLRRPLSVSKIVLYDEEDIIQAADVKTREFTMTVIVNGKLLKEVFYDLYEGGVLLGTYKTDINGCFQIKNEQTAVFKEAGLKGESFIVRENWDPDYGQIFPENREDHEGYLNAVDNAVTFINGTSYGNLMIRKEYIGENQIGEDAVEEFKTNLNLRKEMAVTLTMEVTTQNGETYIWPKTDETVTIIDELEDAIANTTIVWKAGSSIVLEPWKTISLTGIDQDMSYKLYESKKDQQRLYEWQNDIWIQIRQKTPASNQAVSGTVEQNPLAVIVNDVTGLDMSGSRVRKEMRSSSEEVPTGAELVWRLEEYDGTVWNPKGGISYLVFDDQGPVGDQILQTGANGLITLSKTQYGYPVVQFMDEIVKLNYISEMRKGDLRLVEVLEHSDPEWGYFSGYVSDNGEYGIAIPNEEAKGFLNSNLMAELEIEKIMEETSEASFTMILEQVLSASTYPVTGKGQIIASETRGGITYTVYDSETDELLEEGLTTVKGEIVLKAGQYAKVQVPDNTLWTVCEQVVQPYSLVEMTGEPQSLLTELDKNLMLVQSTAEYERDAEPIALTQQMVNDGVIDANTGSLINLTQGDVVIPKYILVEGEERVITSIGTINDGTNAGAYRNQKEITSLIMPDSVTEIGRYAFDGCSNLTNIIFSKSLVSVERFAFRGCSSLITVVFVDGLASIGDSVFSGCSNLTEVILPDGLLSIGSSAFSGCSNLTEVILPDGLLSIRSSTFYQCSNLTEIELPNGLVEIENNVFNGCSSLVKIVLPDSLIVIGSSAFSNCISLAELEIPNNVEEIGDKAFSYCSNLVKVEIPDSVQLMESMIFSYCSSLVEVKLSSGLDEVPNSMFYRCYNLTKVDIPDDVMYIKRLAFFECISLIEIDLPSNLRYIEVQAFDGCKNLVSVELSNSVKEIGNWAFRNCSNLREIEIPNSIERIQFEVFEGCTGLEEIIIDRIENAITGSPWGADPSVIITWTGTD